MMRCLNWSSCSSRHRLEFQTPEQFTLLIQIKIINRLKSNNSRNFYELFAQPKQRISLTQIHNLHIKKMKSIRCHGFGLIINEFFDLPKFLLTISNSFLVNDLIFKTKLKLNKFLFIFIVRTEHIEIFKFD